LCHPGTIYGQRDLRPLLTALKKLRDAGRDVIFEQIGHVENLSGIQALLAKYRISDRVQFTGPLSHAATLDRMARTDIFVVIQPGTILQIPSKIYEMLFMRKRILALTGGGATANLVESYGLGAVASPTDCDAIATAIGDLWDQQESQRPSDADWRRATDTFDGRRLTGQLGDVLNKVAQGACPEGRATLA
jgi:glycosyltransferase involved in cell wall biosynthesis